MSGKPERFRPSPAWKVTHLVVGIEAGSLKNPKVDRPTYIPCKTPKEAGLTDITALLKIEEDTDKLKVTPNEPPETTLNYLPRQL